MRKWLFIPILGIIIGEFLIFRGQIVTGVEIHIANLLAIILLVIFGKLCLKEKNILQSLTILPLLRLIDLSIPQLSADIYVQYAIMYGVMFIPIYLIMKSQYVLQKESGTALSILLYTSPTFKRLHIYVPTVVLIIVMMGTIGQYIGIIPAMQIPSSEVTYVIGEFVTIFLIIILSISLLVSDTKYWSEYISRSINIYSSPLLLTFVTIVIHKIMIVI
jgi:hypothetical protein